MSLLGVFHELTWGSVLVVQAILYAGFCDAPRLWIVILGAVLVATETMTLVDAPLFGLARMILFEYSALCCALIDLFKQVSRSDIDQLVGELFADDVETEVALRDGQRLVARIIRRTPDRSTQTRIEPVGD